MLTENFAICMRAVQFLLSGPSGPGEILCTVPHTEINAAGGRHHHPAIRCSCRYLFCTYVSRVTCHMATRLNGRDGFGTFQRGRIHVSIDIFNLNSFLFRRWETIIVFLPSRGLLWGFNIYAVYVFPNMNMHNLAP